MRCWLFHGRSRGRCSCTMHWMIFCNKFVHELLWDFPFIFRTLSFSFLFLSFEPATAASRSFKATQRYRQVLSTEKLSLRPSLVLSFLKALKWASLFSAHLVPKRWVLYITLTQGSMRGAVHRKLFYRARSGFWSPWCQLWCLRLHTDWNS